MMDVCSPPRPVPLSGHGTDPSAAAARHATVIVPYRDVCAGKTRLSSVLDGAARSELSAAMLKDAVTALRLAGADVIVAAGTSGAARLAGQLGLPAILDPQPGIGLRRSIDHAIAMVGGDVAVVMPDLPLLGPDDVDVLLRSDAQLTIAPTSDGGTGALLMRGIRIATCFGPDSAAAHLRAASSCGATTSLLDRRGFALDVDTGADLELAVGAEDLGTATREFISRCSMPR